MRERRIDPGGASGGRLEVLLPLPPALRRSPAASARLSLRASHLGAVAAVLLAACAADGLKRGEPGVFEVLAKWTPLLLTGFAFNLLISFLAMAIGTVLGAWLGLARISLLMPVRGGSWLVVQFFRNSPWLVLLFFVMFLIPFEFRFGETTIPFPDWIKATVGLALPVMANIAEVVRGAVQSIPVGQWESAYSLAFNRRQTLWRIILPQCFRRMLPPWMNWYAILTMATPLASIVGVSEVITITQRVTNAEGRLDLLLPIYSYVLLMFFAYCYPIACWTRRIEARYAER